MTILHTMALALLFVVHLGAGFILYSAGETVGRLSRPSHGIINFGNAAAPRNLPHPNGIITVVSHNIGYASGDKNNLPLRLSREEVIANLDEIVAALARIGGDIVFLQEVDFDAERTHGIDQMRYIAERLALPHAAYAVTWNKRYLPWPYWPFSAHFGRVLSGQVLLSKFPIKRENVIRFPKPGSNPFWYNLFYLNRIAQHAAIDVDGERWHLWNVHLEAYDEVERRRQLVQLARAVAVDQRAVMVAGDFNEVPNLFLKRACERMGFKRSGYGIDHILYAQRLSLMAEGYVQTEASDHFPVWARLSHTQNEPDTTARRRR